MVFVVLLILVQVTCRLLGVILEENTPEELQVCDSFMSLSFLHIKILMMINITIILILFL